MSLICASRRNMMTRKIARLMDINVFIFVSHVFDAFLALCLNDNRDNRDNSFVEQAYRKAINQELSLLSLLSFKTPQAGQNQERASCRLFPLSRGGKEKAK